MWLKEFKQKNKKIYSQGGQDGIINHIINNIKIDNKYCVEFGFDSPTLTGGCGPNCANLVINKKWNNLFIGGDYENKDINLYKHFLTTDNILDVFAKYNVPKNLGYISVDVDSTDLWLTDKLLQVYKPSFYSVEFNPNVPLEYAITNPNDPKVIWQGGFDNIFGCSLKCLDILAKKYDYSLVYAGNYSIDRHHDAFFIRNDLIDETIKENIPKLQEFNDVVQKIHGPCRNNKYELCLDYEHYLKSNNLLESVNKIKNISKIIFT